MKIPGFDSKVADGGRKIPCGWTARSPGDPRFTIRERVLATAGGSGYLNSPIADSARAARLAHNASPSPGIVTAASSTVGPLLSAYVLWVLLDVMQRGGRSIHFLARDGQIMAALCRRLVEWLKVDIDIHYTYGSRQAFLLSSLAHNHDIVERALEMAESHGAKVTLAEAITGFLKFTHADLEEISRRSGLSPQEPLHAIDGSSKCRLLNALNQAAFSEQLRKRAELEHKAAIAYLASEDFFAAPQVSIVDVGWRGNIQSRLQKTVDDRVQITGYYFALPSSVLGPEADVRTWMNVSWKAALIETMTFADHTSVGGFGFSDSGLPLVTPPIEEDTSLVAWGVREQHATALTFVRHLTEAVDLTRHSRDEVYRALRTAGFAAYRHFSTFPTPAEAEAYGGAKGQANPARTARVEIATKITSMEMMRFAFDRQSRSAVSDWYMGSIVRSQDRWAPALLAKAITKAMELLLWVKTWRAHRHRRGMKTA